MNILIKSAKIINAATPSIHLKNRDILIKNGIIENISASIEPSTKIKIIEHENLHVSLGWFDSGVSFGEPGHEERETIQNGLLTAAKSGFTDVILNPTGNPVPDGNGDIIYLKNAAKGQLTSLHPLATLTVGAKGQSLSEMYDMTNAGAVGFYDFKSPLANANLLKIALQYAQNFSALIYSFPMDRNIAGKGIVNEGISSTRLGLKGIPALSEELQIARDLFILEYTGGKLFIPTISTAKSVKLIADAKKKGLNVSCSVAVHNLIYTDESLEGFNSLYKVLPPLRTQEDCKALIKGVKNKTIDMVTSDHMPLNIELKHVEFDNADFGTIGLESSFGLLSKIFTLEEVINILTNGREIFNLNTPLFEIGNEANFTLFDPDINQDFIIDDIHSTSKNSIALGENLKGKVLGTIANSNIELNI